MTDHNKPEQTKEKNPQSGTPNEVKNNPHERKIEGGDDKKRHESDKKAQS